jgi:hypothetical protein
VETTERSRYTEASGDGYTVDELGNFPIWSFLDQPQNEQFALGFGKVCERSKDSRGKRQAVVDGIEVGVHDRDGQAQALSSAVLDASLA